MQLMLGGLDEKIRNKKWIWKEIKKFRKKSALFFTNRWDGGWGKFLFFQISPMGPKRSSFLASDLKLEGGNISSLIFFLNLIGDLYYFLHFCFVF